MAHGTEVCRGACAWRCGHGRPDGAVLEPQHEIRAAPFTAVLFRAEVFQQAGLLDESFESYLEDVEFGIRCATKGIEGIYVPDATGRHRGSATHGKWSRDTVRPISRNQVFLVARHFPGRWLLSHGYEVLVAQTLWGLRGHASRALVLVAAGEDAKAPGATEFCGEFRRVDQADVCRRLLRER